MRNKKHRRKIKNMMDREKLKAMLNDESQMENFKDYIDTHNSSDDFKYIMDIIRELRIDTFFENELKIDKDKLKEIKNKIIKISPNSKEYQLHSRLFCNHNGNYKVETLFNQYHDRLLKEGYKIGFDYGNKFLVQDIQNGRFTKENLINMTHEEILEYCEEQRDEI